MLYALLECVFTLSGLCGLFVCTVLFGRDVCLSGLCIFNVKCDMLYWSVFLPCLVYVGCLSGLCCFRVVFFVWTVACLVCLSGLCFSLVWIFSSGLCNFPMFVV